MLLRFILVLYVLLHGLFTEAQSRYRFFTLGMEQGLTSDFAWSVCQDKYNYIWIGTQNGLNRYDGHRIKQYFHDPKDSFSIPGNSIYWMYKDADGELWFSLGHQGVSKYNFSKDRFEKFFPFDSIKKINNYMAPLWRIGNDAQGRIYFACGGAVFRYTKSTGTMEDLTPLFKGGIDGYGVGMFIPQGKDILWIVTGNGLFHFDLKKNFIRHIPFDKERMGFGTAEMHDGEFINDHEMLLSVTRGGFVLFDAKTEKFRMPPEPFNPTRSRKFSETGGVHKDSKGRIWIANSRYGLLEYLPATNTSYSLKNEPSYPYPYTEQEGNGLNVYEDNEGNIWYCSSNKGVIWFKPDTDYIQIFQRDYSKTTTLPDNAVTFLQPLEQNRILIGTNKGIAEYNSTHNKFKNFPVAINDADVYPHSFVRSMVQSGDSVFIATYAGLSIYNSRSGKLSRFVNNNAAADSILPYGQWLIHYTNPGELIITGHKAVRFNLNTHHYEYNSSQYDPLYTLNDINASFYDEKNKILWLEAGIGKLYSYHTLHKTITPHNFSADSVWMIDAIKQDEQGNIWLGTTEGLFNYNPVTKTGKKISLNGTKEIYNISIQNKEWMWLSTPREVVRYNRLKGTSAILPANSFLPNSVIMKRAFVLDDEGFLWVGTNKGFCKIDTRRFQTNTVLKEPQLVDFFVLDKPKAFAKPYQELDTIVLTYNENFFSFDISSFNYRKQSSIEYRYLLKGFDKDWQVSHGNKGSYTNVPPGVYHLYLRSSNGSGGWIEKKNPVMIIIQSPFWQTWWFILILALVFALMLATVYQLTQKRKRKKQMGEAIDYFANSLYGENSVNEICWDIARNCTAQLKLKDCEVYLLDEKRNVMVRKATYDPKNPNQDFFNPVEIEMGIGIVGVAAQQAKPVLVKDTSKDIRYVAGEYCGLSELSVPIIHEGKAIGVIDTEHPKKNFFTDDHVKALSTIAAISANKIAEAKAEETAKESELQLLEIKRLLAESQLMALRAQMNPHFVFNCLNSIQECIVTEKYADASLYLNKFSKLFRSVLNNSGKVMITLADEIEVLELYLALEHMRFEKSFDYTIEIEEDLEIDEILIPAMLLQPYVENSLWHGLMHKDNDRRVSICFRKLNEDVFQCIVDDNGIGRKKAFELKEQQSKTKRHVSRGMSITKDRLDLLQKQGKHALLDIIDKYDDKGEATGTKVVIELSTYLEI